MVMVAEPAPSGNVTPDPIELPLGSEINSSATCGNNPPPGLQFSIHPDDTTSDWMHETAGSVVQEVDFSGDPTR